jgi:hypothetical protein
MSKGYAASNLATCTGAHVGRLAGVRTPRASSSWAMAAKVVLPDLRITAPGSDLVPSSWRVKMGKMMGRKQPTPLKTNKTRHLLI